MWRICFYAMGMTNAPTLPKKITFDPEIAIWLIDVGTA